MLHESVLDHLRTVDAKVGETVQFGWFVFRVIGGNDRLDLETLDFRQVASFTTDFKIPEQIYWAQHETLRRLGAKEMPCVLNNPALVSRSYQPRGLNTFIERCSPTFDGDCGWYVGVIDKTIDFNDPASFVHRSLYELTIHDERLARFWLLPVGYRVYFDQSEPRVEKTEQGVSWRTDEF